jgi:hypothetical protein
METTALADDEPKTDAWYEAEVDRMLLELQRMQAQTDPAEERRRSEAHRAEFDATMAEINKTLNAIAAERRLSYSTPVEEQDNGNVFKHHRYKRRRKVS